MPEKYTSIETFLASLDSQKGVQVEALRTLILSAQPNLTEHIKWNAPSYIFEGEDRITFNVMNKEGLVKIVFHMGATRAENKKGAPIMHDESGLVQWSSDIRGTVTFTGDEDVGLKSKEITNLVKQWIAIPIES